MGNVSRQARSVQGLTGDWRNLIDPWEYLAYTLINRASKDYTQVCNQIRKGSYNDDTHLIDLNERRNALRDEFTDRKHIVARVIDQLPVFESMDGYDILDRIDSGDGQVVKILSR